MKSSTLPLSLPVFCKYLAQTTLNSDLYCRKFLYILIFYSSVFAV